MALVRLLLCAVQVVSVADPKHVTVPLVEPYPVQLLCLWCAAVALQPPVDDVGSQPVPRHPPCSHVSSTGAVQPLHHVMAAGLGVLRCHPEPYCGFECQHRVLGNQLRAVETVKTQCNTSLDIVVAAGTGKTAPGQAAALVRQSVHLRTLWTVQDTSMWLLSPQLNSSCIVQPFATAHQTYCLVGHVC